MSYSIKKIRELRGKMTTENWNNRTNDLIFAVKAPAIIDQLLEEKETWPLAYLNKLKEYRAELRKNIEGLSCKVNKQPDMCQHAHVYGEDESCKSYNQALTDVLELLKD